ncbi:MAG: ATP-binding protein [Clostridiales bacterium]|jgi:predicted AAA+ superfamily ATPase|nr:ATP-binding protein [Clostridiales bacterium]
MDKSKLTDPLYGIGLFKDVLTDGAARAMRTLVYGDPDPRTRAEAAAELFCSLANGGGGAVRSVWDCLFGRLALSENPFSAALARGKEPAVALTGRAKYEYGAVTELAELLNYSALAEYGIERGEKKDFSALVNAYKTNGCGVFAKSKAFGWDGASKRLVPLYNLNPIRLDGLKDYADEKAAVKNNTESFLNGLPACNVLLYGDRGTGKSSTVHALLNEYGDKNLRLIELKKSDAADLTAVINLISGLLFKFIVFFDDLTFAESDESYGAVKAALEGSVVKCPNMLVYASSNRRHLIAETRASRENGVHLSDSFEEQLSLFDRFGLVVTYLNPDKNGFLSVLKQILSDRKISVPDAELALSAERYALQKGGRSPRAAKQLADIIESSLKP